MSLTAIGVGMAALAVIGGGLGIGFATSSAVKAIAQQPEAHGKIRSTLLIGAALAEATAIYGFDNHQPTYLICTDEAFSISTST